MLNVIVRENLMDKVRVLVSNNGSSDGTKDFLEGFSTEGYSFVKIYHQKENIGFSANLLFLWKETKAKYVWSISDDDFYSDRLILQIIKIIFTNSRMLPNIAINSFHFTGCDGNQNVVAENLLDIQSSETLIRYDAGLKDVVNSQNFTAFGLLGALVFSRELIRPFFDMPELLKSSYPHQLLLFKWLYIHPVIVLNDPCALGWRAEDSNWSLAHPDRSFNAHFIDYMYILDCTKGYLNSGIRKCIYKTVYRNAFWAIIRYMTIHKLGVRWALKWVYARHVCYRSCSPKLDFALLLFSFVKLDIVRSAMKSVGVEHVGRNVL